MLNFRTYAKPDTLEEAWKLNQSKANCILGGTGWLKLGQRQWGTAIDLSGLGLDTIEELPEGWRIGAMVTLRQLETHPGLNQATGGAVRDCVKHIVGVQFRNCATVGGTLWGRYGFSDVLTCFLVLEAQVELYRGGKLPLEVFAAQRGDNDLLTHVFLPRPTRPVAYDSFRNTETDFPVLAVAVAGSEGDFRCAVGARPARGVLVRSDSAQGLLQAVAALPYGTNTRASGDYRAHLAQVLTGRCLERCKGGPNV